MLDHLLSNAPLTLWRLVFARLLSRIVRVFKRQPLYIITRKGITYEVDLKEGLDLSLFLFGGFQSHVAGAFVSSLPAESVVVDIGANVGILTLEYARRLPKSRVYAIEPTRYAFSKLQRNVALNPELAQRISIHQMFCTDRDNHATPSAVYSSWNVGDKATKEDHQVHGGHLKSTDGASSVTLDAFCRAQGLNRLDLIKIDTDGYEMDVLAGGVESLRRWRPIVVLETGQYLLEERGKTIADLLALLPDYVVLRQPDGTEVTPMTAAHLIPRQSTVDCLAIPRERFQAT